MKKFNSITVNIILFAGVIIAVLLGLMLGSTSLSMEEIWNVLTGGEASEAAKAIVKSIRLPRVAAGVLAGAGLSVAGVILQTIMDNPLASPNIIGVNSGAGFAVLIILALFPESFALIPAAAFLGALLTTFLILALAHYTRASKMTIVLAGIAVSGFVGAGINTLTLLFPDVVTSYNSFTIGGLSGVLMRDLYLPGLCIIISFILSIMLGRGLNVLSLGDDVAASLGMRVNLVRMLFVVLASILAGCVVSFAGLIGFVGLIVPHVCRKLVGNDARILIPASGMFGAILMVVSDIMGRVMFSPYELPVGIITAFLGGPFFMVLLLKGRRH